MLRSHGFYPLSAMERKQLTQGLCVISHADRAFHLAKGSQSS
ncbi:hypothetical protein EIO_1717 [Ketogulonicigenium vulgare Y25]|uniref:Uncharacterized protein n=1 Tax=Ketogulonicigenium vulgare (strain WSH-001) TaxID=759362 RepID=F9Y796_KETVW|nr:hypothetical protein EIO_1717 [Ketogulonicigenium vulgare Y25]AEM41024.1 hypothetical protein KVU_1185 [Ketogulonicigenium vulgare WSH-001]ALJ81174.1 hypothetical protein KVH_08270 [Ketogulonicigenium vulgare]ANW35053.1 hypothetical protein KvSKV_08240 [Ketogulonicigenium vulgare]AOZ54751.1 hypothetical protein KVC_1738 [Ketogulonicigenium vulgare]